MSAASENSPVQIQAHISHTVVYMGSSTCGTVHLKCKHTFCTQWYIWASASVKQSSWNSSTHFADSGIYRQQQVWNSPVEMQAHISQTVVYMGSSTCETVQLKCKHTFCTQWYLWAAASVKQSSWNSSTHFADSGIYGQQQVWNSPVEMQAHISQTVVYMGRQQQVWNCPIEMQAHICTQWYIWAAAANVKRICSNAQKHI